MQEWSDLCVRLRSQKVLVKDLLSKPAKKKKADIVKEVESAAAAGHDEEDEVDKVDEESDCDNDDA